MSCLLGACATGNTGNKEYDETKGWTAERIYTEAREEMNGGGWDRAIKLLEVLEAKYPFGRFAQQAQMDIAYSYWKNSDKASAVAACDRFIKLYPNHAYIDYMYYLRGLVNFNEDLGILGKLSRQDPTERDNKASRESFDTFKELVTRFPDSKYAPDARLRLQYLVFSLAKYEVHVARYYMKRGAYVAAINRAQNVITVYPNTPAQEEALYIISKAYEAMGMKDLAGDARKVLDNTYPNSTIVRNNGPVNNDPWWKIW
ncbi:MAG: outer membrane protein assembly factor BamD [Betaproteobacteria bacterium]|nr:outer membrane protein assembly factor BamD [Betaproteobacteria bacterium]